MPSSSSFCKSNSSPRVWRTNIHTLHWVLWICFRYNFPVRVLASISLSFFILHLACDCGLNSTDCYRYSGSCTCPSGVTGSRCDLCIEGMFNLSNSGCQRKFDKWWLTIMRLGGIGTWSFHNECICSLFCLLSSPSNHPFPIIHNIIKF